MRLGLVDPHIWYNFHHQPLSSRSEGIRMWVWAAYLLCNMLRGDLKLRLLYRACGAFAWRLRYAFGFTFSQNVSPVLRIRLQSHAVPHTHVNVARLQAPWTLHHIARMACVWDAFTFSINTQADWKVMYICMPQTSGNGLTNAWVETLNLNCTDLIPCANANVTQTLMHTQ